MLLQENENVTKERVSIGRTKKRALIEKETYLLNRIFKFFFIFLIMYINYAKGQWISEGNFGVFKSPQKQTFFEGFLPYEAGAEILQEKSSLFGRFEFTKISFWD